MTIALDQNLGIVQDGSSDTTISLSTAQTVAAGGKIISVAQFGAGAGTITFSVGGLTWTTDLNYQAPDGQVYAIGTADAAAGLSSSSTLTATCTSAGNPRALCAVSFTGLALQGVAVDASSTPREHLNSTVWACNSLTTTHADALVFAMAATGGVDTPSSTADAGWTEIHDRAVSFNSALTTVYQIVSSTGDYAPSGVWSTDQSGGAEQHEMSIAYKAGSAVVAAAPETIIHVGNRW